MKRLPWWMAGLTVVCSMMHGAGLASAAPSESIPAVIEADEGDSGGMRILWQAEPGVRYDLRTSQDLNAGFDPVPGFPTEATALWQEHRFPVADRAFFRIEKLDEQHPVIIEQYPTADGFAVGRSADLYILLSGPVRD